jgi:hypothetical protein
MQPLGLNRRQQDAYHDLLMSPHDFKIDVDVLRIDESHIGSLKPQFIDGQVNLQRDGLIKRTATMSFYDPDHSLHLDNDSPFEGAVFADRMLRATHVVDLPGFGKVEAVAFVGPIVKVSREGDVLNVECQDKTLLAVEGCPHKTVKKGKNAVDAIRDIMADCTGERRFRFPKNHKARLSRSYSVGWKPEASPWKVCQKIANQINMQLVYAGDGALLLRRKPHSPALVITEDTGLTGPPRADYDLTNIRNIVRVTGEQNKKKHIHIAAVAKAKAKHPMSPRNLGRNGVPRYLPLLIDDASLRKHSAAQSRANRELQDNLSMGVNASFPSVPIFHLDYGDPIRVRSDWGSVTVPFVEASIPLGLGGDATTGAQKRVSKARRR